MVGQLESRSVSFTGVPPVVGILNMNWPPGDSTEIGKPLTILGAIRAKVPVTVRQALLVVSVEGRLYRKAGSIAVRDYQLL
jgi:hypothetical protein